MPEKNYDGLLSGGFQSQQYLIKTGIQNLFDEYNKQIGSLDRAKQQEIEDAYYVRELSKKYLGEYASNVGIGDVSGDLLNLYGSYQQNIGAINQNFETLQMNLDSSYQQTRQEYELGLAQTQIAMNEEERMNKMYEIEHNILTNNLPEGMTTADYLGSVRETIGDQAYWQLMTQNTLQGMGSDVDMGQLNYSEVTGEDIGYLNPSLDIPEGSKVFRNETGEGYLAETGDVYTSGDFYKELQKAWQGEEGDLNFGNTPFAYGGSWYYREGGEFRKLRNVVGSGSQGSSINEESNQENFTDIDNVLKGESGMINGQYYKYENGEYTTEFNWNHLGQQPENKKRDSINIGGNIYHYNNQRGVQKGDIKGDLKNKIIDLYKKQGGEVWGANRTKGGFQPTGVIKYENKYYVIDEYGALNVPGTVRLLEAE